MCFAFLQNYDLRKRFRGGPETLALIIGILAVGILWSLIWLFIYTGVSLLFIDFVNNSKGWGDETLGWEPEGGVLIFVLVVEYFSLFLKVTIVFICFSHVILEWTCVLLLELLPISKNESWKRCNGSWICSLRL